jgi:hypothetical protein
VIARAALLERPLTRLPPTARRLVNRCRGGRRAAELWGTRQIRTDEEFEQAIDELRRLSTPVASISTVIRQAVLEALERARAAKGARAKVGGKR